MAEDTQNSQDTRPRLTRAQKALHVIERNPTARIFVQNSMLAGILLDELRLLDQTDATIRQNQGFSITYDEAQDFINETIKLRDAIQKINDKGIALLKKAKDKQVTRTFNDLRKKLEN